MSDDITARLEAATQQAEDTAEKAQIWSEGDVNASYQQTSGNTVVSIAKRNNDLAEQFLGASLLTTSDEERVELKSSLSTGTNTGSNALLASVFGDTALNNGRYYKEVGSSKWVLILDWLNERVYGIVQTDTLITFINTVGIGKFVEGNIFQTAYKDSDQEDGSGSVCWVLTEDATLSDNGGTILNVVGDWYLVDSKWNGDVRRFGISKNSSDNKDAFALLDAITSDVSNLYFPAGTYLTSDDSIFTSLNDITISGDGSNNTFIKFDHDTSAATATAMYCVDNVELKDFTLQINDPDVRVDPINSWNGIVFTGNNCSKTNVKILGFEKPFLASACDDLSLAFNEYGYGWNWGCEITSCKRFSVLNCKSHHNGLDGFKFKNNTGNIAVIEWEPGSSVETNYYRQVGLNIYKATNTAITGWIEPSHISGTVSDGNVSWEFVETLTEDIRTDEWKFTGSFSYSNGQRDTAHGGSETTNGNGLDVFNSGINGVITESSFWDNAGAGMVSKSDLSSSSQGRLIITSCRFYKNIGNVGHGFQDPGSNVAETIISNCRFYDNEAEGFTQQSIAKTYSINNSQFINNGGNGVKLIRYSDISFNNCIFLANGSYGVAKGNLLAGFNTTNNPENNLNNLSIKNCVFSARYTSNDDMITTGSSIYKQDVSVYNIFTQESCNGIEISGCSFYFGGIANDDYASLRIESSYVDIVDNYFSGSIKGILISRSTVNNLVERNTFEDLSEICIDVSGSNAIIKDNKWKRTTNTLNARYVLTLASTTGMSEGLIVYWGSGAYSGQISSISGLNALLVTNSSVLPVATDILTGFQDGVSYTLNNISASAYGSGMIKADTSGARVLLGNNDIGFGNDFGGSSDVVYLPDVEQLESYSTTSTTALAANDTTVTVTDATGFAVGQTLAVELDNGQLHRSQIGVVSGSDITFKTGVPSASSIGNVIKAIKYASTELSL